MKIAIAGSGALGLYYGACLARLAESSSAAPAVHFLARSDYAAIRERGLRVRSIYGDFALPTVAVYRDARELAARVGPMDLILVGLKTTANAAYQELIEPIFSESRSAILCLQNGIGNEEALARLFPASCIIGGTAFLCSNRTAPGEIDHTEYGYIRLAAYAREYSGPDLELLAAMFRAAGVDCQVDANYTAMRWRKQIWNVPFNCLCTLHNTTTDQLFADAAMNARIRRIMSEVVRLGAAISTRLDPDRAYGIDANTAIEDLMGKTATMGAYQPSMLLDLRNHRPLELDAILYACVRQRDAYAPDLAIPEIEALCAELRAKFG